MCVPAVREHRAQAKIEKPVATMVEALNCRLGQAADRCASEPFPVSDKGDLADHESVARDLRNIFLREYEDNGCFQQQTILSGEMLIKSSRPADIDRGGSGRKHDSRGCETYYERTAMTKRCSHYSSGHLDT
jgi:hypothetical protein